MGQELTMMMQEAWVIAGIHGLLVVEDESLVWLGWVREVEVAPFLAC